jgi:UDP-glucose 4-epimerase
VLPRLQELAGAAKAAKIVFVKVDLCDANNVERLFASEKCACVSSARAVLSDSHNDASISRFDAVIHFAGLKAVGEVRAPTGLRRSLVSGSTRSSLPFPFEGKERDPLFLSTDSGWLAQSVAKPLLYYSNNIGSTTVLLAAMAKHGCKTLVFSSSATVYGEPASVPITEAFPLSATNPYGRT